MGRMKESKPKGALTIMELALMSSVNPIKIQCKRILLGGSDGSISSGKSRSVLHDDEPRNAS